MGLTALIYLFKWSKYVFDSDEASLKTRISEPDSISIKSGFRSRNTGGKRISTAGEFKASIKDGARVYKNTDVASATQIFEGACCSC